MHHLPLFAATLLVSLPGQAPAEMLRLSIAGPATWRARLQPTNLGSMLSSAAAERIWHGYVDAVDRTLRTVRKADEAFAQERTRLLDYGGTLHVVTWLEQAEDALHVPRWSAALVAEPDGHSDLSAMAGACEAWFARVGERASNAWRDVAPGPAQLVDGRLVVVFAGDDDRAPATARAHAFVGKKLDPRDVLRLELEVPPTLGLLRDREWERGLVGDLLGAATQRLALTIGAFGPQVAFTVTAEFGDGVRGALGCVAPPRDGVPDLHSLVPDGTATWLSWQIDASAGYATFVRVLAGLSNRDEPRVAADLRRAHGIDVMREALPLLGSEALLLWPEAAAVAADLLPESEFCLLVPVRDEQALRAVAVGLAPRLGANEITAGEDAFVCQWPGAGQLRLADGMLCLTGQAVPPEFLERLWEHVARWRPGKGFDRGAGVTGSGRVDVARFAVHELYADLYAMRVLFLPGRAGDLQLPPVGKVAEELDRWLPMLRQHQLGDAAVELRTWPAKSQLRVAW